MNKVALSFALLAAVVVGSSHVASAQAVVDQENENKIAICHRDNNVKQPYGPKKIEVNQNSVDGEGRNDHTHHTGPVATSEEVAQELKDNQEKWGDIIPPFGEYEGLNWTAEGQAIWNNNCQYVVVVPVDPEVPTTPDTGSVLGATTAAPQVTAVPVKGVSAGGRGSVVPTAVAAVASLVTLGYGVLRFRKFNA